jgi:photosystem II stability/assembly factor-like uncharacterized protein
VSNARSVYNAQNVEFRPYIAFIIFIILVQLIVLPIITSHVRPAAAAPEVARWTKVSIPAQGEAGRWALSNGSDIKCLAMSGDGTLYAYLSGPAYTLYRSRDGGHSWEHIGDVQDAITGIAISPHKTDTVYYATVSEVYRSKDGGRTFTPLLPNPGGAGTGQREITSIDVAHLNSDIIVVGTRDKDSAEFGGVYTLDEADIIPDWEDTNIGGYDIHAVTFSSDFPASRQLVAVATDESDTYVMLKTGNTGWNAGTGYARLDVASISAGIAFTDMDNGGALPEEFICFVAIDTGTGQGDVYKIEGNQAPGLSVATDLNAGFTCGQDDIDITGLAACGDESRTTLLAGTADSAMTLVSTDGGTSWTRSRKAPTGGAQTGVLLPYDFESTGRMYAFTGGKGSALSVSLDSGETWNQLSLIDTTIETIVDLAPSPRYGQDETLFMLTFGSGPSTAGLWRSTDGGNTWERLLTSQPDTVDILRRVALPPQYGDDCRTVLVAGESHGKPAIWESTDNGQFFRRRLTRDMSTGEEIYIDTWAIADKTTIYVGSYDGSRGMVHRTVNSGLFFSEGRRAGNQPLYSIALSPGHAEDGAILCGNTGGRVYLADKDSPSFHQVPVDAAAPPFSGPVTVAFDPEYSKNSTVYAAGNAADEGVYRFVIGTSTEWESISNTLPAGAMLNGLAVAGEGTIYAANSDADGGLERCLNPTSSTGTTFETITRGLSSGATLCGLWQADHRIWSVDASSTRVMVFYDTLTAPVALVSPEPGISAVGNLIDHTVRNITLDWETIDGATSYQWECGYSDDFTAIPGEFDDTTSAGSARLPALEPATTYHWRVRTSSPALGPWSQKRTFTTIMDTESITLRPESPAAGATGVPLKPAFQWTAVLGAEAYELFVFTDAEFSNPAISMADACAIPGNVWQCDISLDYDTTYYWRVRAINGSTYSAWSTIGIFTTETAPAESETPEMPFNHEVAITPHTPDDIESLAANPAPTTLVPPAPPEPEVNGITIPPLSELPSLPTWIVIIIGGLLSIIILALTVILAIVLKMRLLK